MGLSAKQVSSDQGIIDWEAAELSNPPPPTQRQPPRQQEMEEVKCPRCDSTNTKFCYYNNYNKSQPRHFCKSCKRHWTKGGTLRNVPVGGDRKNKRPRISNAPSTSAAAPIMGPTLTTHYTNRNTDFTKMGPIKDSQLTNENTGIRMGNDRKDVSSMIYEALIGSSSSPSLNKSIPIMGSNNKTVNETGVFQFSSLSGNFDVNSLIPNSCGYDQFGGNFDSMEDSTITTVNITGNSSGPWPGPDTSYWNWNWNWNEIDVLTSADHLNIVWDDDSEIKP